MRVYWEGVVGGRSPRRFSPDEPSPGGPGNIRTSGLGWARWYFGPGFSDCVMTSCWFVLRFSQGLQVAVGPADGEGVDLVCIAQSEVKFGEVVREVAGHGNILADVFGLAGLNGDKRTHRFAIRARSIESHREPGSGVGIVAVEARGLVEVGHDEIKVAIAIEITVGGTVTHADVIEAPVLGSILEGQITAVSVGEILFRFFGGVFVVIPFCLADLIRGLEVDIGVIEVAGHAV